MNLEIVRLVDVPEANRNNILSQVEEIFFLSTSVKSFASEEKRLAFFKKWCGDYLHLYAEEFFVALEGQKVLGYLSGCADSERSLERLNVPGHSLFRDLFERFPAHLHINFHPDARGKGLGSKLVLNYMKVLKQQSVKGLHLTTSPDAQNVSFYDRLGFKYTETRELNGAPLYFMGAVLD